MAQLIHCDGPDCDKNRPGTPFGNAAWSTVKRTGLPDRDFCSDACMAAWAGKSQATRTTVAEPVRPDPEVR